MIAIVEISGKQYKVEEGTIIDVDKQVIDSSSTKKSGQTLTFDSVLLLNDGKTTHIGKPTVRNASVAAEVLNAEFKDKKVTVFKFKRKTGYKVTQGHRQKYTRIRATSVTNSTSKSAPKA